MEPAEYLDALLSLPGMFASLTDDFVLRSQPTVSWNGKWVAWTWFRAGPAADVYVAPTDGSTPPTRLTDTLDNTSLVSWMPDSRSVLVEQDKDGNERAQLFRVGLNRPLVMVPLTEPEPNYFIRGGNLHPNGRWLVYGANFDVETGQEIEPTWIYRHDLETGERRPLARPAKGGYISLELNSAGTHILYPRMDLHPAGCQIWLVDIEGREDREILNFGADVKTFASWFPDGQRVLVMAETKTHCRLGVWEVTSGTLRWLIDDPARNIEDAFIPHGSSPREISRNILGNSHILHPISRGEPGKIGITGTSYGGYSSWCTITRFPPEIVAASAPICGMTDLVVDYETTRPDLRPYSEEMMGGSPPEVMATSATMFPNATTNAHPSIS